MGFEGFREDAFLVLDTLRVNPHIDQYWKEKGAIGDGLYVVRLRLRAAKQKSRAACIDEVEE